MGSSFSTSRIGKPHPVAGLISFVVCALAIGAIWFGIDRFTPRPGAGQVSAAEQAVRTTASPDDGFSGPSAEVRDDAEVEQQPTTTSSPTTTADDALDGIVVEDSTTTSAVEVEVERPEPTSGESQSVAEPASETNTELGSTELDEPLDTDSGNSSLMSEPDPTDVSTDDDLDVVTQGPTYFSTDFSEIDPDWELYDSIGHGDIGLRRPSAITVHPDPTATGGSVLKITAQMGVGENLGQLVSGGLAFPAASRTYGRYTFRVRIEKDPQMITSGVSVLWPTSQRWPEQGEINMFETWNHRATRSPIEFNVHWLSPTATPPYVLNDTRAKQVTAQVDGSQWHTYTYEWAPNRLSASIDDGPPILILDDTAKIPHSAMTPTFQVDAFSPTGTRGIDPKLNGPISMYIDFLRVEPLEP